MRRCDSATERGRSVDTADNLLTFSHETHDRRVHVDTRTFTIGLPRKPVVGDVTGHLDIVSALHRLRGDFLVGRIAAFDRVSR